MRNPVSELVRSFVRVLRAVAVLGTVPAGVLLAGTGVASAAPAGANAMTSGLLGPVGLAAVVLGIVGMAAGVVRQRRKARAAEQASAEVADLAEAMLAEEPAQRAPA